MKVITENALISIQRKAKTIMERTVLNIAIANCQELDTLTVSKLRPMSEAVSDPNKRYNSYLFKKFNREGLEQGQFDTSGKIWIHGREYFSDELEGWIPIPVYKPEQE